MCLEADGWMRRQPRSGAPPSYTHRVTARDPEPRAKLLASPPTAPPLLSTTNPTTMSRPAPPPVQQYRQDYIVRIRYANTLPPPANPPKLLDIPNAAGQLYTSTSFASKLARGEPANIEVDSELGLPLDLTHTVRVFEGDDAPLRPLDSGPPPVAAADRALLRPASALGKSAIRGPTAAVSFLRRTEYISSEQSRSTFNKARVSPQVKKRVEEADPVRILEAVLKGFDVANPQTASGGTFAVADKAAANAEQNWKTLRHPMKPTVRAVETFPLLPDMHGGSDQGGYTIFKFSSAPTEVSEKTRDARVDTGLVKPVELDGYVSFAFLSCLKRLPRRMGGFRRLSDLDQPAATTAASSPSLYSSAQPDSPRTNPHHGHRGSLPPPPSQPDASPAPIKDIMSVPQGVANGPSVHVGMFDFYVPTAEPIAASLKRKLSALDDPPSSSSSSSDEPPHKFTYIRRYEVKSQSVYASPDTSLPEEVALTLGADGVARFYPVSGRISIRPRRRTKRALGMAGHHTDSVAGDDDEGVVPCDALRVTVRDLNEVERRIRDEVEARWRGVDVKDVEPEAEAEKDDDDDDAEEGAEEEDAPGEPDD